MKNTSSWLVLEGDWGGQIYLTVPARLVSRDSNIPALLAEMHAQAWACNEGDGAGHYFYDPAEDGLDPEDGVCGGMGGGDLINGLWLHEEFRTAHWVARARELLGLLSAA